MWWHGETQKAVEFKEATHLGIPRNWIEGGWCFGWCFSNMVLAPMWTQSIKGSKPTENSVYGLLHFIIGSRPLWRKEMHTAHWGVGEEDAVMWHPSKLFLCHNPSSYSDASGFSLCSTSEAWDQWTILIWWLDRWMSRLFYSSFEYLLLFKMMMLLAGNIC